MVKQECQIKMKSNKYVLSTLRGKRLKGRIMQI